MMMLQDTIVALATPPLKSALAIIRMSGQEAFSILETIFSKPIQPSSTQSILTGWIVDRGEKIDQVVVLLFQQPHSFTGENVVEIMSHGSPLIAQQIIQLCLSRGARSAQPGEFSSRAFLNQKMDLIQAEAIQDIIDAVTPESKKLSLLSLEGKTSLQLHPIRQDIADLLAQIEVNIDYPEYEDIQHVTIEKVIEKTTVMLELLETLIQQGEKGRLIKEGIKVAIVGRPNVGKSSLLNALIHDEKAIVTDVEGTTRDVVEAEFSLEGVHLKILDTAGIRESSDLVEKIGIQKSIDTIQKADLVLYVFDASDPKGIDNASLETILSQKQVIRVYNKKDLLDNPAAHEVAISAKNQDLTPLLNAIKKVLGLEMLHYESPSFYNTRQLGALANIQRHIQQAREDAKIQQTMDIISSSLQLAYEETITLLGLEGKVDLSEEIFSRFCVGK